MTQLLLEVKKITDFKSLPDGKLREAIQKMKRKLKLKTDEEFYYYIKFQPYSKILLHQYLCDVLNTRSKFFKDEETFEILRKEIETGAEVIGKEWGKWESKANMSYIWVSPDNKIRKQHIEELKNFEMVMDLSLIHI